MGLPLAESDSLPVAESLIFHLLLSFNLFFDTVLALNRARLETKIKCMLNMLPACRGVRGGVTTERAVQMKKGNVYLRGGRRDVRCDKR